MAKESSCIVKEAQEAATEYNNAIEKGHGAFLLEEHHADIFECSVENILPRQTVHQKYDIKRNIPYQEYSYVPEFTKYELSLLIECKMTSVITNIESPSHLISCEININENPKVSRITLGGQIRSIDGLLIQKASSALELFIRSLLEDCYFNIVLFSDQFDPLFKQSEPNSSASLLTALLLARNMITNYGLIRNNVKKYEDKLHLFALRVSNNISSNLIETVARNEDNFKDSDHQNKDKPIISFFSEEEMFLSKQSSSNDFVDNLAIRQVSYEISQIYSEVRLIVYCMLIKAIDEYEDMDKANEKIKKLCDSKNPLGEFPLNNLSVFGTNINNMSV
ncbi:14697_t:CDS:2 [Funneliformis caledonium]|uniref:14697_t:CDS:1 n=1 Tax=Funneliformis caledonium TaxID=1117310 RepID=A0A9N9BXL1_9GLOM|nr:14697_t:CDS:2 [Funneliformis caledonium]